MRNRAWVDAGLTSVPAAERVQTVAVPAGGGGVFDVKIDKPGHARRADLAHVVVCDGAPPVGHAGRRGLLLTEKARTQG